MEKKTLKSIILVLLIGLAGYFLLINKLKSPIDIGQKPVIKEEVKGATPTQEELPKPVIAPQSEKDKLLSDLKLSVKEENYTEFAGLLKQVYRNNWSREKDFELTESKLYVLATDKYFKPENLDKSLEVATVVYNEIPQSWRFRYLRIKTLEKFGRNAFEAGDLAKAEGYANQILSMMYRIEGANLLADIYLKKIEAAISSNDKKTAAAAIKLIQNYDFSQDRQDKLNALKTEASKL